MNKFELKTLLMRHQEIAAEKLSPLKVGALFMEMGTGKSRTAIELAFRKQSKIDKVIWITPVALKQNVFSELLKHCTSNESDIYIFDDKTNTKNIPNKSWYIVGLESVSGSTRVAVALRDMITPNTMILVDESSYIKGYSAMRTVRITQYASKARYRYILTGTPISQGIVDLYSQFRFLSPKILGYPSFYSFAKNHLQYDTEIPDRILRSFNIPFITSKIEAYTYQVKKEECIDLPEKIYSQKTCGMSMEQMNRYDECKEYYFEQILNRKSLFLGPEIFSMFTALQQIASGFWHRRIENEKKWILEEYKEYRSEMLLEQIRRIDPNAKIIIWAKYHYEINKIMNLLTKNKLGKAVRFDGSVPEKKRGNTIAEFRSDARFFLSTQSCGGHGLTLNEAEYSIFYSNGFKYSERIQAEDRNHRIGQLKKTTYIDVVPDCGIERRIQRALKLKSDAVTEFRNELAKIINDDCKIEKLRAAL